MVNEVISACGMKPNAPANNLLSVTSRAILDELIYLAPVENVITSVSKGNNTQVVISITIKMIFFLLVLKKSLSGKQILSKI